MTYVPIVPTPPTPPSPRTRELAGLLARVLDEYRKAHPSVTGREIRDAMRMALSSLGPMKGAGAPLVALGVGVAGMVAAAVIFFLQADTGALESPAAPMIIVAVLVFVAILLAVVKGMSR